MTYVILNAEMKILCKTTKIEKKNQFVIGSNADLKKKIIKTSAYIDISYHKVWLFKYLPR